MGEGLIPGKEYLASLDDGTGRKRVVIAVQIPASFDPKKVPPPYGKDKPLPPCRGKYGSAPGGKAIV